MGRPFARSIQGWLFWGGLSLDKDTLYLRFVSNSETHITLEIKFIDGHLMILTSDRIFDSNDYRKGIVQFKEIENQPIFKIVNDPSDRWICIVFSNRLELWFKGFGKYGNVMLRKSQTSETIQIFRLSQNPIGNSNTLTSLRTMAISSHCTMSNRLN